jgi:transcription elongation factor SPT5
MGISSLRENSIKIVPLTEMTGVFNFDKIQKVNIKANQWVRIKSGLYENDLAQIVHIEDPMSKIYIRIIPRLVSESFESKKDTIGEYSKKIRKSVKPPQKLFNPLNFSDAIQKHHPILSEQCHMWNKQSFINGFLIKSVRINSLITEDIVPKIEELKIFEMVKYKSEDDDKSYNIKNILDSLDHIQIQRKRKFTKGDKIKIIKGGLKGITGKIDFHSEGVVRVVPDIEGITDLLEFPEDYVVKEFLPGDLVKIISGPHIGKQGLIVKVEEEAAYIFSESTNSEFIVGIHDLVYSNFFSNEHDTNSFYNLGDLVRVNGMSNNISYIIEVNKYNLKLIDTRSEVKRVSVNEVTKLTGL